MSLILLVDAKDEALAAGFWIILATEFVGVACGLSLDDGIGVHVVGVVLVRGCHELVFPAEKLFLILARRPCTSLSALQAR
jgi:hypothetical protein